jgi:heme/copper-type cytochrome/quinol oxidase subunit 2
MKYLTHLQNKGRHIFRLPGFVFYPSKTLLFVSITIVAIYHPKYSMLYPETKIDFMRYSLIKVPLLVNSMKKEVGSMKFWREALISAIILFLFLEPNMAQAQETSTRVIHLYTIEHNATINGQKAEVYRWDPGQIVVKKGETVSLHIHGFHGKEHIFSIPKLNIKGKVHKGMTTTVTFSADQPGTYELICHNHFTSQQHGPMIGYITVIE